MDRVFFTNSGTEAIEGAIKLVRKYAYNKDGRTDHEIIAMKHSFHGRSMGALSVTGNDAYQAPFKPLIGGVRFAEYNNLESVKSLYHRPYLRYYLRGTSGRRRNLPGIKGIYAGTSCPLR